MKTGEAWCLTFLDKFDLLSWQGLWGAGWLWAEEADLCHLLLPTITLHGVPAKGQQGLVSQTSRGEDLTSSKWHSWELGQPWDLAWLRVLVTWSIRLWGALGLCWAPQGGDKHYWVVSLSSFILSMSTFSSCFSPFPSPLYLFTWMFSYTNQFCGIYQHLSCFFSLKVNNLHILMFH